MGNNAFTTRYSIIESITTMRSYLSLCVINIIFSFPSEPKPISQEPVHRDKINRN